MTTILSATESDALTALRTVLLGVLPAPIEVVRGQDNRVAEPSTPNFVVMTPIQRNRLGMNVAATQDNGAGQPGYRFISQSTRFVVQCDVHGPNSGDNAQIITTIMRDQYGYQAFLDAGSKAFALYTSDPRQVPFINDQRQYENRWTVDVSLQISPTVTVPQDFADRIIVDLVVADNLPGA